MYFVHFSSLMFLWSLSPSVFGAQLVRLRLKEIRRLCVFVYVFVFLLVNEVWRRLLQVLAILHCSRMSRGAMAAACMNIIAI